MTIHNSTAMTKLSRAQHVVLRDDATAEVGVFWWRRSELSGWEPLLAAAGFRVERMVTWFSWTGEPARTRARLPGRRHS